MVALQILALSVRVRILLSQQLCSRARSAWFFDARARRELALVRALATKNKVGEADAAAKLYHPAGGGRIVRAQRAESFIGTFEILTIR